MAEKTVSFDESNSDSLDPTLEMFNDDEMELLFRQEVAKWLSINGNTLFQECFNNVINIPQRKKVKVIRKDTNVVNNNK